MRIRVGDLELTASVAEVLDRGLAVTFRAPKLEMHEQLLEAAGRREHVFSPEDDREWRIADVSFAYVGSEPWGMHHHTWRLEQVVHAQVGALRIGAVELEPYDYREEVADGLLRFALRAPADDAQLQVLAEACGTIVEVARAGEAPSRVLLDAFVWGLSSGHGQAVALRCTEQTEPRLSLSASSTPDLTPLLLRKGVLTPAELLEMLRVSDIDAWDL